MALCKGNLKIQNRLLNRTFFYYYDDDDDVVDYRRLVVVEKLLKSFFSVRTLHLSLK